MHKKKKIILLLGDIAILYISLYLALSLRFLNLPSWDSYWLHLLYFSPIFLVWIIIFYIFDFYNLLLSFDNAKFFKSTFNAVFISASFSVLFFYLNSKADFSPKTILAIFLLIFLILFFSWRYFFNFVLKTKIPKQKLAFVGNSKELIELIKEIKEKPQLGYRASLLFDENNNTETENIKIINSYDSLSQEIKNHKINTIVLENSVVNSEKLRNELFACLDLKVSFVYLANFYEQIMGKIPIESINRLWFLENLNEGNKSAFDLLKQGYDFILAIFILASTFIFWPIISIAIKMESKGPIFFTQERLGKNNKIFKIIKFRTMFSIDNDLSPTKQNDARITRLGAFLRKTRIDEIPQVLNIIKGDMSFVGPRPERPELALNLEKTVPFFKQRLLVRPGLTGSDQISGEYHSPSPEDTIKKLQYDLFYIKNRSLYLDLSIILKTIATVIGQKGI